MHVNGIYFSESKQMLENIEKALPTAHKKAMLAIKVAMDNSAGKGMNGEPSCTSTVTLKGYQVTANVCCGGWAEVEVIKVKPVKVNRIL